MQGKNSPKFVPTIVWNILPTNLKCLNSNDEFKQYIR